MKYRTSIIISIISIILLVCCLVESGILVEEIESDNVPIQENIKQTMSVEDAASQTEAYPSEEESSEAVQVEETEQIFILSEGMTLESRFAVPEGYERIPAEDGSLTAFLRSYELKPHGSPVLLYDGREKYNQSAHAAVFTLPMEEVDLQQCADSIMRVYAEYYWHSGQFEKIGFHFTNGFWCDYVTWRDGYRVHVNGNNVSWSKDASVDDSYECFTKYLRMVFNYAGTLSMDSLETETIPLSEMEAGDVILTGGSPGHVVMVADVCVNEAGEKAFLLAQGYMPAQEFHVLNNPLHEQDPWYYSKEMTFPLNTAEYIFDDADMIKRLNY